MKSHRTLQDIFSIFLIKTIQNYSLFVFLLISRTEERIKQKLRAKVNQNIKN